MTRIGSMERSSLVVPHVLRIILSGVNEQARLGQDVRVENRIGELRDDGAGSGLENGVEFRPTQGSEPESSRIGENGCLRECDF
ncbi:hypothetical protein Ancab_027689 [Ancistrocladus abbreviatus]